MKKKLLFVVDERKMGGVSVVLTDMIHFLDKDKYEIDVLVLHNKGNMLSDLGENVNLIFGSTYFEAIDYTIGEVLKTKSIKLIFKKIRVVFDLKTGFIKQSIKRTRKKCVRKKYDVEIAFKDGFTALFTAYGDTPKKVHWLHCAYKTNNPNEKYEKLFKSILPQFDKIVGVATNVVKEFNEIYHLEDITEVIPVAMDTERIITLSKDNAKTILNKNKINIAVVGRAHPVKGYDRMIKVFSSLNNNNLLDNACVHIYGDGPLFHNILSLIKNLSLEKFIFMNGAVANPYKEMKEFDFLLLPSYSEAFGTVISEAFIVGLPVLATRTSASEMSIKEGYNGWICENNENAIYLKLEEIIQNQNEIDKCKDNLKKFNYNNEKILNRIEELFFGRGLK